MNYSVQTAKKAFRHENEVPRTSSSAPESCRSGASALIGLEVRDHVGILTMNHAAKRNALSHDLMKDLLNALTYFRELRIRAVILRAAPGMKVWSAGHDVRELPRGRQDPLSYQDPMERLLREIRTFPGAVIAMVQGSVWGGALDLLLSSDIAIADASSSFAITPVNIGLPYNTTGLLHFLHRLPVNLIKEMFFSAQPIDAHEAAKWGLINHLVAADEIESFTFELADVIASKAPLAIAVVKEQLRVLNDFHPVPAQVFERLQDMRRQVFESTDYEEGITAFLEKRKPVFHGR